GEVADKADPVADHHALAAQLAGLHRGDLALALGAGLDQAGVPAPVDGQHHALGGVLVGGPDPGARPGALAGGAGPDVVLVGVVVVAAHGGGRQPFAGVACS